MVPAKLQDKVYGAVQEEYFRYIGFCKKVRSQDTQNVDVFIDRKKVDTLVCDKFIEIISKSYDKDTFGFEYHLPEEYIGSKHVISFFCNGQDMEGSPLYTIDETDEKYNEYLFFSSFSKSVCREEVKNIYTKNSIGILAIEENLRDCNFVDYVKELTIKFPETHFKLFYFSKQDELLCNDIFDQDIYRFEKIIPLTFRDILQKVEIFITVFTTKEGTNFQIKMLMQNFIKEYINKVVMFGYSSKLLGTMVKNEPINNEHPHFQSNKFLYTQEEKNIAGGNIIKLLMNSLYEIAGEKYIVQDSDDPHKLYYFERVRLILKNEKVKARIVKNYI